MNTVARKFAALAFVVGVCLSGVAQLRAEAMTAVKAHPDTALTITTTELPTGSVGIAYSATVNATGGVTPYTWSLSSGTLPAGLTLNASTGVISGTPTTAVTAEAFTVKVTDSASDTATQGLTLTVYGSTIVRITTTSLPNGIVGDAYTATLAATSGTKPYTWSIVQGSLPAGLSIAASTGVISGTPTTAGTSSFLVGVKGAGANTATAELSITINPALSITTTLLPTASQGIAYSATVNATGGLAPYTWSLSAGTLPTGLTLNASTGVISGTPTTAVASQAFTVEVADSASNTATQALTLTVYNSTIVRITTTSLPNGMVGVAYSATLAATSGTKPYTWSIVQGSLPAGLSLAASTGVISGTPTTAGTSSFLVGVKGAGANTATAQLSITITAASTVMITTTLLPTASQGISYSYGLAATGGTAPYTWSVSSGTLPAGLTLNSSTGVISGTPTTAVVASLTFKVTDSASNTATASLSLTVYGTTIVRITTTSLPNGTVGVAYSATLAATSGTKPYTWSVVQGTLPAGLSLAASTGVISGTPTTAGTSNFFIGVKGSGANTATAALSITINMPSTLMITTTTLPNGIVSVAYTTTLAATGGVTPYTWSISSGTLPAGLSLNSSTGVISGTPTTAGNSSFTVKVTDADSNTATANLSIMIVAKLTITSTSPLPAGMVGTAYSFMLGAVGGTAPYTWSITAGSLPAGLTLNTSTGVISGTPTTAATASFTVKVADSGTPQQTATAPLSLTINPATLVVTTTSLPSGTVGTAYSATLMATGGVTPYTWSISSGSLPAGLTLAASTGVISGTPTTAETSSFTVKVTDSDSDTATANLSITINSASTLEIITTSLPTGTVSTAYTTTLEATGGTSPYTWSITSGTLPAGLSLTGSTGVIAGTPTTAGNSSFTIKVADSASHTATANVTIKIYSSLTITTRALPNGATEQAYSSTLSAAGGTTPYTWALASGSLPTGLTLASSGAITGTVTCSCDNGQSFPFQVSVTDSENPTVTVTANFNITINSSNVSITTNSLASGAVGTAYSETLSAENGATPYTWSLASGTLPAGLSLSSSGAITGTPTTTGTSRFVVQVSDADTNQAQKIESITIYSAGLQVVTTTLQYGNVGEPYSKTLMASGGTTPYTWSITTGSLPTGLSLSSGGSITGTPTTVQTASFTVKVTDSASNTATLALSLQVFSNLACPSGSESQLSGTYALTAEGLNGGGLGYRQGSILSFTANGAGLITGGEADVNSAGGTSGSGHQMTTVTGGTYSVGSNGRGCAMFDLNGGSAFTVAFALGTYSSGVAEFGHVIEYDDATGDGTRATGDIVKQTTADFSFGELASRFAFAIRGTDASLGHFAFAGSLTNSATGVFSNVFGDTNDSGTVNSGMSGGTGGFSGTPDAFGRTTASITIGGVTYNYIAYIVNSDEVFLLSSDPVATNPVTTGLMLATASSFTASSFTGNYIVEAGGSDVYNSGNSFAVLALFNSNGSGTFGVTDWQYELNGPSDSQGAPNSISNGTYTVGASSGRVFLNDGEGGTPPVIYLTNNALGVAGIVIDQSTGVGTAAFIGSVLVQPSKTYSNSSVSGNFIDYTPGLPSNQDTALVGFTTITSGNEVDIVNESSFEGLIGGVEQQSPFTITSNGSGYAGLGATQSTLLLTNGTTIFLMDVGGVQAQIIEIDQQ